MATSKEDRIGTSSDAVNDMDSSSAVSVEITSTPVSIGRHANTSIFDTYANQYYDKVPFTQQPPHRLGQ
ncbi:hypothetical protein AND_003941 [Anopheles darlingi]|uniref:Uncharacterized protein n=1 Tax=Anopheles darlingi TaxID=43151 RepID=W5JN52_ANODA|nr:hypothetical protein AND_003941 [Anopheles darlingi]